MQNNKVVNIVIIMVPYIYQDIQYTSVVKTLLQPEVSVAYKRFRYTDKKRSQNEI